MSHLPKNICIRVMAEYGSSGTWEFIKNDNSGWRHTMVTHRRLGLSKDLSDALNAWIKTYENQNLSGTLNHEAFNGAGLSLAYRVYEELDRKTYVEFEGESQDSGREEPIDVGNL